MTFFALLVGVLLGAAIAAALLMTRRSAREATLAAELAAERRLTTERSGDEQRLSDAFARLSADTLERQTGAGLSALSRAVGPLTEKLGLVDAHLRALETAGASARGSLTEQVRGLADAQEQLRRSTEGLVQALRAPSVRGAWGELQLRRVVELAGLQKHVDFVEQHVSDGDLGRQRPDLVVRLPDGGSLVVDSKVPLTGWLQASAATSEQERAPLVAAHGRHLRAHVDALAGKRYWHQVEGTPELVVLFVPGEPILSAALEAQPDLYEHALSRSVLLATPTSLVGLLKTIGYGWRQQAMAENAAQVAALGRELHERLARVVEKVDSVGKRLDSTVTAYNEAVGSLEGRVLVSARRLAELGVTADELASPRPAVTAARRTSAPNAVTSVQEQQRAALAPGAGDAHDDADGDDVEDLAERTTQPPSPDVTGEHVA